MGVGLLAKYTMVLLGGAVLVFVAATPGSRYWLRRREPYLAAGLALVIFSPVIAWNAANGWASFYFQGIGRHGAGFNFGLQDLIGSTLLLLTPTGLLSVAGILLCRKRVLPELAAGTRREAFRLLVCLTFVPLAVFFGFSLFRMSKLNWTGPIWLGVLPLLALFTQPVGPAAPTGQPPKPFFARLWPATTATVLVLYGALLHYLVLGLPGVPYPHNLLGIGKRDLARQISEAAKKVEAQDGQRPLVVCWKAERMAGWMAYYLSRASQDTPIGAVSEAALTTTGPHLFGDEDRMFSYWHPAEIFRGRLFLFVAPERAPLNFHRVLARATPLGRTQKIVVRNHGEVAGTYFYRLFRANGSPAGR
jgi:dolichol-phosphate mannosyltransferase